MISPRPFYIANIASVICFLNGPDQNAILPKIKRKGGVKTTKDKFDWEISRIMPNGFPRFAIQWQQCARLYINSLIHCWYGGCIGKNLALRYDRRDVSLNAMLLQWSWNVSALTVSFCQNCSMFWLFSSHSSSSPFCPPSCRRLIGRWP